MSITCNDETSTGPTNSTPNAAQQVVTTSSTDNMSAALAASLTIGVVAIAGLVGVVVALFAFVFYHFHQKRKHSERCLELIFFFLSLTDVCILLIAHQVVIRMPFISQVKIKILLLHFPLKPLHHQSGQTREEMKLRFHKNQDMKP